MPAVGLAMVLRWRNVAWWRIKRLSRACRDLIVAEKEVFSKAWQKRLILIKYSGEAMWILSEATWILLIPQVGST